MQKLSLLCAFLFSLLISLNTNAQTTQASFTGKVTNAASATLEGATVVVKNESTGFSSSTVSNAKGEYVFKELPLGGPYFITVSYTGYTSQKKEGYTLNQGDVVAVNFSLNTSDDEMDEVVVTTSGNGKGKVENLGAATSVSPKLMSKMPINGRNFTNLTDLSPLSRGGSISGQLGSSTNFTIDGMNAKNPTSAGPTTSRSGAPYSIPLEAVREFKVVTNQYDVTYGRSGGGTVSAVTKSGTNTFTGSAFRYERANELTSKYDIRGNKRDDNYSTAQYGFSLAGPIIKDKLHFFAAWDHQQDKRSLIIADIKSPIDETRFNATRQTLDSVVLIGRQQYGLPEEGKQYGSFPKKRSSDAAFLRLDWQINDKNLLTLRNNLTNDVNKLGLIDNTSINLYESAGNDFNFDNSLLLTLRSAISPRLTNELKVQHLYTWQSSEPGDDLPAANIPRAIIEKIPSEIGGAKKETNFQFGGHRFAQEWFKNNVFQIVDNVYLNTDNIRYTFGTDLMYTKGRSLYGSEVNGRFHYDGWEDYINNTPYRYFREVPLMDDPSVVSNIFNIGLYGQLQSKFGVGMEITAGIRADYSIYPKSPLNQLVFDELQIRTDNQLKSFIIQPRFQFTWDVAEKHRDYVRIGGGIFASDINNYMLINNLTFDGKHFATVDVRNPNVPDADFIEFRQDPSTTPKVEAQQIATINTNGPDVKIPIVYKANVSYTHFFTDRLKAGITGYMTLGRNNYNYVDRNMVDEPYFRLANEANRGVYVPSETIPVGTASGDWLKGRKTDALGRVLELNSDGKVNQFALVFDVSYNYFKDGEISASYTWNDAKDNISFNGNVANTSTLVLPVKDDPRNLSIITYSDGQFRNKVVFYATSPTIKGFSAGVRYSGMGGTRYTLTSGVNTNADFVTTNDLAYIFDRNNPNTPQTIKDGLQKMLDNPKASQSIKDYILEYEGQIAERNGGVNGFYGVWDLRVSKKFSFGKNKSQGVEVSADLFNVANLINKEKGSALTLGNQAIYSSVKNNGFDPANKQYNYSVNTAGVATPSGNPWQLQLGLRYSF